MSFSDILTILEILISVIVGFYLAHWYSVRDAQHRAVKDYYLGLLSGFQQDTEFIFHGILDSAMSGAALLAKIDDMESALEGFDEDLRRALSIKLPSLQVQIGDLFDELTNLRDINEQLENASFSLGTQDRIKTRQLSKEAHRCFAIYINQINVSPGHHAWHELKENIKTAVDYYKKNGSKHPIFRTIWGLICAFGVRLVAVMIFLLLVFGVWNSYKVQAEIDQQEKLEQRKWRNGVWRELNLHNTILNQFEKIRPEEKREIKNYYDCEFHRYDTCDSIIYERVNVLSRKHK